MRYRFWYIVALVFVLFSCDTSIFKKENKEDIIKERLDKLTWNEVEQPPLFEVCKKRPENELEACFQNTITEHFYNHLLKQNIKIHTSVSDTIWIPLIITKNGIIRIEDLEIPDLLSSEISDLRTILENGVDSLPEVAPAHTRGTPVTTKYRLPLVIHMD